MDPNIGKTIGKERTDSPCKESLPTSCGPHRKRFLEVKTEIRSHMTSDKKTLLQEEAASTKRNLMSVGGHTDTPVDLVATGNDDVKHPCLGNGQIVLMRTPTPAEFVECCGSNIGVYGQGNCSYKEGYYFLVSPYIHQGKLFCRQTRG
jgi:hypothetical protein